MRYILTPGVNWDNETNSEKIVLMCSIWWFDFFLSNSERCILKTDVAITCAFTSLSQKS